MNKLILIGNGFDLAHGLPTSYNDFLDDFWTNIESNYKKEEFKKLITIDEMNSNFFGYKKIENFDDFYSNLLTHCENYGHLIKRTNQYLISVKGKPNTHLFSFKSNLFKIITTKKSIENWVDIENEYYSELKKIATKKYSHLNEEENVITKKELVIKLNDEFEQVKNLLVTYLTEKVLAKFDIEQISTKKEFLNMYELFKPKSLISDDLWENQEFSYQEDIEHIDEIYNNERINKRVKCQVYIVNFNYTGSPHLYYIENHLNNNGNINSIHGEVDSEDFKPVFGFGDEIDEDYKLIENLNDNEYLKYFKSFQYFQNKCYDGLLKFIDKEKFQVSIMGHSCGLSDRVLLNTIFEHENCRSIKVFYHQKNENTDNYTDLVYNISRHFKNKSSMRRKIVAKEFSTPLPQNVRFKGKNKES